MKQTPYLFKDKITLLERALDFTRAGITITDPSLTDIVYVNDGFLSMSGYTHEEVIGKNCRFLQGDETDRSKVKAIKDAISEDEAKYYFIGIQKDITKQEEYQDRLETTLKEIDSLSTPLVPITENTFILPLNGNLTDERFEKITETVISSINISRADYLILDLSGLAPSMKILYLH
ncbi:PAS domain-containing protein [Fictibacillus sp. B-59209]|uniref:PAS domain-containing protein n=1 Tax=Fictibacillus sp. B-59209 TaxID=3024873 RepID=UPI002E1EB09B|nr:PAS domain-containing protein [Fictibacillus sp. B-59209]